MSGTETPKVVYWDACIYLAWLKDEENEHGKLAMDAIRQTIDENFKKNVVIVTSTLTFVEVLSAKLTDDQERIFRKSFRFQDHISRDVDPPVARKARDFRQNLLSHESGKSLSTPDAIHLATASIYTTECWTLDDGKKDKRHLGLLALSGDTRIGGLIVKKPSVDQQNLL